MTKSLALFLIALGAWIGPFAAAPARADVTDKQVAKAIRAGVNYLYQEQHKWGNWDVQDPKQGKGHEAKQYGGWTAIACYALLSAGEQWQNNPKLEKPLKFLADIEIDGTYAVGLRAHVWPKLPDKSTQINFLEELREDAYLLINGINAGGAYRYKLGDSGYDHSCTQYGALGAWECAKRGVPVPVDYWQKLEKHFLEMQTPDGGWAYTGSNGGNLQMTAAGLAVLYMTLDYLHSRDFERPGVTERHPLMKAINDGLGFMNRSYKPSSNGYTMVGVERVALGSGMKFFNNMDWYQTGASAFIKSQKGGAMGGGGHGGPVVSTSYALVFLSRGRVPVFANKLQIPGQPWNNRPRDLANMAKWASDEFEIDMNWQVVGIDRSPADWLDAPILYLASHKALELTEPQIKKIKRYIDMGGMLVTASDGGSREFSDWVKKTFESAYPYKFQPVSEQDDLYNIVFQERNEKIESLHNGVRHLIVHFNGDPGRVWQTHSHRVEGPWRVMGNIFQYAIEKSKPRNRLEAHYVKATTKPSSRVHIGRAKYDGNWNPEPLAWPLASVRAANDGKPGFALHRIDLADIAGADLSMVHVAGTESTEFTDAEIDAVRKYVNDDGGVMFFEAAGGDAAFTESVTNMLLKAFPEGRLRMIDSTSRVLTGAGIGGYDSARVNYRVFYKQRLGASTRPGLLAITINGEPRVFVSPEDLSTGMIGQPVWGIFGYDAKSAVHLATNIALHAASLKPAEGKLDVDDNKTESDADADAEAAAEMTPDALAVTR